jgi:hypothetical protein
VSTTIVPIGRCNGLMYPYELPPNDVPEGYEVQAGDEVELLTEAEFTVWDAAHDDVQLHGQLRFDRSVLVGRARERPGLGDADPGPIIDKLVGLGLLYEGDLDDANQRKAFLSGHQLIPTADGMGNTPDEPQLYWLGVGDQRRLGLPVDSWALWSGSYRDGTLWQFLEAGAAWPGDADNPRDPDMADDPELLAGQVIGFVGMIVASRCGFLDPFHAAE